MKRLSRRAMAARIAELEADNARISTHLRVSLALNEIYMNQKIKDDFAKRVAEGPGDGYAQSMRSLYIYGSLARPPHIPPTFGGIGV